MRGLAMRLALLSLMSFALGPNVVAGQTGQTVKGLVVVDSTDKRVGDALSLAGPQGATVAFEIGDELVVLDVNRERFIGGDRSVRFETEDCTGPAYAEPGALSFGASLTATVVSGPGSTVYVGNPGGTLVTLTLRSQILKDPSGPSQCRADGDIEIEVLPVTPVVDLDSLFTPPFRLEAAPPACCGDCNDDSEVTIDELVQGVGHALIGCP